MTSENGDVLKECKTRMSLMRTAQETLGKTVGELCSQVDKLSDTVSGLTIEVGVIKRIMDDDVVPLLRGIPSVIAGAIREHEAACPVSGAVREKTRKDVTEKLLISRPPANDEVLVPEVLRRRVFTKQNLVLAIGGLIMAAIGAVTKWLAS